MFVYPDKAQFNEKNLPILIISTFVITVVWVAVSLLTTKPDRAHIERLKRFYRQVRPSFGWGPVARAVASEDGQPVRTDAIAPMLVGWISSTLSVYSAIIGFGKLLLLQFAQGALWLAVFAVTLAVAIQCVRRMIAAPGEAVAFKPQPNSSK